MPFTPTHLAAVLPIARLAGTFLPFSALAIGSMIPDWPLFVPFPCGYGTTHSVEGLITADLPLGLFAFVLFHLVMKQPLAEWLPGSIRRRVGFLADSRPDLSPGGLARASLALVIGAATHLFWDSFTHQGRWGTELIPWLEASPFAIAGHPVPGYKVLQYGSTIVLLPVLLILSARWLSRQDALNFGEETGFDARRRLCAWLVAGLIPSLVTMVVVIDGRGSRYDQLGRIIRVSGLVLLVTTLGSCVIETFRRSASAVKRLRVAGFILSIALSLLPLSSYFAYTTAGFDFETSVGQNVDVLYLRLRWDDGSTWIGFAVQPVSGVGRELEWFDPGGTLFASPTRPRHRTFWNDLGFWRVEDPSDDPYVATRYPGAWASCWWACPSWLILCGLWSQTSFLGLRSIRRSVFRREPHS